MKQIAIVSGKGGTGKTVLTASFAALGGEHVVVDCDVDASNLHLLLHPQVKESRSFSGRRVAVINQKKCIFCASCRMYCRFGAVSQDAKSGRFKFDPVACEGCGVCARVCPEKAITMEERLSGEWFVSETKYGSFVHAKLGIAEENSGKLVSQIRQTAREIADSEKSDLVIIDGPPGVGCPVISSLGGVNLAVAVTEPTLSGLHDLERIVDLTDHFRIQTKVVINKFDINEKTSNHIESRCQERGVPVIGRIPFSTQVMDSVNKGIPVVEYDSSDVSSEIETIWSKVRASLS